MSSIAKMGLFIAAVLAASGQLKSATLKMAEMAIEAQKQQISYGAFSRILTAPEKTKGSHFVRSNNVLRRKSQR
jgi:Na+-translocating ferredoxin:NAD+ oxidoreductase RnfG subunit